MFESLKQHKFIFVIGPQRSRTTITAKMIAYDTGYQYVDENRMNYNLGAAYQLVDAETPFVLQCPSFTLYAPQIAKISGAFLVFLRRNREEILDSQERIDWQEKFKRRNSTFMAVSPGAFRTLKSRLGKFTKLASRIGWKSMLQKPRQNSNIILSGSQIVATSNRSRQTSLPNCLSEKSAF